MQLTEEQLLAAYKRMRDIREFEDRLHEENTNGDIPGFIHLANSNMRCDSFKSHMIINKLSKFL